MILKPIEKGLLFMIEFFLFLGILAVASFTGGVKKRHSLGRPLTIPLQGFINAVIMVMPCCWSNIHTALLHNLNPQVSISLAAPIQIHLSK